jgi:hypothetical protein
MPLRKTAIAIPNELLDAVDRAAASRRESRNQFITRVLEAAARARRDADMTRRLNALFADPALDREQRAGAVALDAYGGAWEDERW